MGIFAGRKNKDYQLSDLVSDLFINHEQFEMFLSTIKNTTIEFGEFMEFFELLKKYKFRPVIFEFNHLKVNRCQS